MIERMNIPLLNEIESIYDPPRGPYAEKKDRKKYGILPYHKGGKFMINTKKAKPKRLLSLLLTLAMVLGMLPAMSLTVSAAEMTYIKHVDIQMTAPRAGMTVEEYAATIGVDNKHELSYNNLVVDTLNCYRVDDSSFDHVGTDVPSFVEDGVYHCFVDIVMNDDTGYQFEHDDSEITVLVNGQTLDNYDYDRENGYVARFDNDGYTLTYALYFTATSITGSGTEDDPYIVTDYRRQNLLRHRYSE